MKSFLQILLITISVYAVLAVQEEDISADNADTTDLEEYGDFFEGDMMLNTDQVGAILNVNQRNGLIAERYRWPSNILFYEIDPVFDAIQVHAIEHALKTLQQHTCLHFEKRNKHTRDYVYVTGEPTGCHSRVGRQSGKQILNLKPGHIGKGCFRIGTIMHEFIHALGFYHQQSASDRDDYVKIIFENIKNGHLHNFQKYSVSKITGFGVPYDYDSVMHYSSMAFSKNDEETIVPLDPTATIGQRTHLSFGDILKLNKMYNCNI